MSIPNIADWSIPEGYGELPDKVVFADDKPKYWMAVPEGITYRNEYPQGHARFVIWQWTPQTGAIHVASRALRSNAKKIVQGLRLLADQEAGK